MMVKVWIMAAILVATPLLALAANPGPASQKAVVYADISLSNLMRAMLRTSALDLADPVVREDYLLVHECGLYRDNFRDEFKLKRLVDATSRVIQQERTVWPNAFTYLTPLKLDRYDFTAEQYLFAEDSQLKNVNSFALFTEAATCVPGRLTQRFPSAVAVRIDQPVTIPGIPLPKAAAEKLRDNLVAAGGPQNRQIYARFSITVSFMPPIEPMLTNTQKKLPRYVFDGRLMQVEFFEDQAMTKPIWTLTR